MNNSFPFDWCQWRRRPTHRSCQLLAPTPSVCGLDGRRQGRVQATCRCSPPDWHPLRGQRGRTWTPPVHPGALHGSRPQPAGSFVAKFLLRGSDQVRSRARVLGHTIDRDAAATIHRQLLMYSLWPNPVMAHFAVHQSSGPKSLILPGLIGFEI